MKFSGLRLKAVCAATVIGGGVIAETPQQVISEVRQEIRDGGLSYSVEGYEKSAGMERLNKMALEVASSDKERNNIRKAMKLFDSLLKKSGLQDPNGFGSSVVKEKNYYDADLFLHLKKGNSNSLLWQVLGGKAQPLRSIEYLPSNTLLSFTARTNFKVLWDYIKNDVVNMDIPDVKPGELKKNLESVEAMLEMQGLQIDEVLKTLSTEITVILTHNAGKTMRLPGSPIMPQFGVTIMMKKQSEFLQNFVLNAIKANQMPVKKSNAGEFSISMVNQPLPTKTYAAFAHSKDWLVLSTDSSVITKMAFAKTGQGLVASEKFSRYRGVKPYGNHAFYLSTDVVDIVSDIAKKADKKGGYIVQNISSLIFNGKKPGLFLVSAKKANGYKADIHSTFNMGSGQAGTASVAVTGVLAAMVLPALGKAREKAKMAKSKSNLKQIGTSAAIYFTDQIEDFKYPLDGAKIFAEYTSPSTFIHPANNKRVTIADVLAGRADYIMVYKTGAEYTGASDKVLAMERPGIWPDGTVFAVFEDGHVEEISQQEAEKLMKSMKK